MGIPSEQLEKILTKGGPASRLVAMRSESGSPEPGKWHRDFKAARAAAERDGKPLVAMWTNGDLCGLCRRFTENILDPVFVDWMKSSGAYFWLGGSMDEENQRTGDGWKYCLESGIVSQFPFFCVRQVENGAVTHQFFGSGGQFDGGKRGKEAVDAIINKLGEVLSGPPQDIEAEKAEMLKRRKEAEEKAREDAMKASTGQLMQLRKTGTPQPGEWSGDFAAVKAEAERTGKPLFGMWINPTCGFCKRFCSAMLSDRFSSWMRSSGMYFWLGSRFDSDGGNSGRGFVFSQSESDDISDEQRMYFPGCAVWQCEAGNPENVLHDYRASGRVFEKEKSGDEGVGNVIARIEQALAEPPHKAWTRPSEPQVKATAVAAAPCPHAGDGGCDHGHPHLKALLQIGEILKPFLPAPEAKATPALRIRMNPALDAKRRDRIIQAIADKGGHCPCRDKRGSDTLCLCKEFMSLDKPGVCTCGLYEKYVP